MNVGKLRETEVADEVDVMEVVKVGGRHGGRGVAIVRPVALW